MTLNLTRLAKILRRFPREPNPHSDLAKITYEDLTGARILMHMYGEQNPDLAELIALIAKARENALKLAGEPGTTATALYDAVGVLHDLQLAAIVAMNPANQPVPEMTSKAVDVMFELNRGFREACLEKAAGDVMKGYALNYAEAAQPRRYGCSVDGCDGDCDHEMWMSRRMKRFHRELGLSTVPETVDQL